MKLSTLITLSAAGMAVTATSVWFTVDPGGTRTAVASSSPSAVVPATPDPAQPATPAVPEPPVVDRSVFQAGKTLMVEGRLGHRVLPADTDSETFLFVDVKADGTLQASRAAPLELAIVIDRSGSMKGKRLANAMAATRTAIERLRDGDVVSVVTYDERAEVVVSPTVIDAGSRPRVLRELTRPRPGGDTCISCGLDTAMRLLGQRPGMVGRILLLSDGLATAGVRDVPSFKRIADDIRRLGVSIDTIGVDVGYDEKIMAALARDSNGEHFFAPDATGLPVIFDRTMANLARTLAHRAELIVDLAPGVTLEHVYDRVSAGSSGQVTVPLGAFTATDRKTALLRLRVPRGQAGERAIAAVRLRYDDLVTTGAGQCEGALALQLSTDPAALTPLDGIVSARVSASESAEALERANALFHAGRTADATRVLQEQRARIDADHARARRASSPRWQPALDDAFAAQKDALSKADSGFLPTSPAVAPPTAGAAPAEAQVRMNQADALQLSQ